MIGKMATTLEDAKKGDAAAKAKYEKAFGKYADIDEVEKTIGKLQNGKMTVKSADPTVADTVAKRPQGVNGFVMMGTHAGEPIRSPAHFGSTFYSMFNLHVPLGIRGADLF
jgi:hypothetical protein